MKILTLEAERIRRVVAVRMNLDATGNAVFVTGENDQGKSSTLESIAIALCGGRIPDDTIAKGFEQGEVRITLGGDNGPELEVRKVLKRGQSPRLIVKAAGGMTGNQGTLDALVGPIGLDPVALAEMDPVAQASTLQKALGLDFSDLEAKAVEVYNERSVLNRQVRDLEGELSAIGVDDGTLPAEEVNPADLVAERDLILDQNAANEGEREALQELRRNLQEKDAEIGRKAADVRRMEEQIAEIQKRIDSLSAEVSADTKEAFKVQEHITKQADRIAALVDGTTEKIDASIANVGALNGRIRNRKRREQIKASIAAKKTDAQARTDALERLSEVRKSRVAAKGLPAGLEALSITSAGLMFDGFPLKALGTGKALRVTTSIVCALAKGLKVVLIRAGNDLDRTNLKAVVETAAAAGVQVWIERIERPQDGLAIEIVDGAGSLGEFPDPESNPQADPSGLDAELSKATPAPKRPAKAKESTAAEMIRDQLKKEGRLI
jgi:hypothetical protein